MHIKEYLAFLLACFFQVKKRLAQSLFNLTLLYVTKHQSEYQARNSVKLISLITRTLARVRLVVPNLGCL